MALQLKSNLALRSKVATGARPCRRFAPLICKASAQPEDAPRMVALPLTALVAAGLMVSGITPEEALAARSGGRMGGGSFSSRSAPRSSVRQSTTTMRNYNTYSAPPVVMAPVYASPFGMPFFGGYGGFGMVMPMGGLFQFFLLSIMVSVAFNVVSGFVNRSSSGSSKRSDLDADDWDEL